MLEFLKEHESENLFLIGDIVDFWAMRRSLAWSAAQNTVVQKVLRRARRGNRVMLIPGNHDEALREYDGMQFGGIVIANRYVHVTADQKRYMLVHGDEFDQVTLHHRWVAVLGDMAYNTLVGINTYLSWIRRRLNIPGYWSLAGFAKRKVKSAVSYIFDFEASVVHSVKDKGLDGVICGHIHSATLRTVDGIVYGNCGDWVDSCTAIVEHLDGRLELLELTSDAPGVPDPGAATAQLAEQGKTPYRWRLRCGVSGNDAVTQAAMGDNRIGGFANPPYFAPQRFDVRIDRALQTFAAVLPDGIHDLVTTQNAPRPLQQQGQQQVFVAGQIQPDTLIGDAHGVLVDVKIQRRG